MSKKDFFGKINMQNPPRPNSQMYYIRLKDNTSIPEYTVLDWEFTIDKRPDSFGLVEGNSPKYNFRKAFLPEEDHYWVSQDFSGQELRIVANLANEKNWIDAFLEGRDIHQATAEAIWGKENYNQDYRKAAKTLNFGLLYGMTAESLASKLGVSVDEAKEYVDGWFSGLQNIQKTMDRWSALALRNGEITNLYGRKRRMTQFISRWGKLLPKGHRRAHNFPVQSMGAEIVKLAIIKIYNDVITNPEFKDKVIFMNTIHDEVNTSICKDCLEESIAAISKSMYHSIPGKPVPILTELEIGNNMGLLWPFKQDPETLKLEPIWEEL